MAYLQLSPKEQEIFVRRDKEVRRTIAVFMAFHIDEFVDAYHNKTPNLAEKFQHLCDEIIQLNFRRYQTKYSKLFLRELNTHCSGLIDEFYKEFYIEYVSDPDLIKKIREHEDLPKDDEYYPWGRS